MSGEREINESIYRKRKVFNKVRNMRLNIQGDTLNVNTHSVPNHIIKGTQKRIYT